ncbi:MAG: spore maturation protein [Ruminococcaceae bacterium]|nr:spore maturation protein [Oscillospiraceae bacterium]
MLIYSFIKGTQAYDAFIEGGEKGLKTVFAIFPALVAILSLSAMLNASGAVEYISGLLAPVCKLFHIPEEILPLAIIRPMSGGGSIGLLSQLVRDYGAESRIARMACILCASTETTFYTIMVYFKKTKVKYTKRVLTAAIFGDLVGILCASILS